jgi:CRP/FNR family transcriptional regulator, cyclic AMP receptor protein
MEETLTLMEKTAFLKSVDMLSSMPIEALAQLAAQGRELHLDAGDVVFREGDVNRGVFLVIDGLIEIRKGRALQDVRGAGMGFGELALREREPHTTSAIATQHSHVLNVSNEEFFDTMLDFPEVGLAMVRILAQRLTEMAQRVHDLEGQVAHLNATLRSASIEIPAYQSGTYTRPPGLTTDP